MPSSRPRKTKKGGSGFRSRMAQKPMGWYMPERMRISAKLEAAMAREFESEEAEEAAIAQELGVSPESLRDTNDLIVDDIDEPDQCQQTWDDLIINEPDQCKWD